MSQTRIDLENAKVVFQKYVSNYDTENNKIDLKLRHTYAVMDACEYLGRSLGLSQEDKDLTMLIGLLHDIGRFEQLRRFNSYDDRLMSHAKCGLYVLFDQEHIRDYLATAQYDDIIYKAIENHSLYQIDPAVTGQALLHAKLIRDADKLDNFRVKAEDDIEAMLPVSAEELGSFSITPSIFDTFMAHRQIRHEDRKTPMDMWISYLAFIYDLNFAPSFQFILDGGFIPVIVNRIPYSNPDTQAKMKQIEQEALNYCKEQAD